MFQNSSKILKESNDLDMLLEHFESKVLIGRHGSHISSRSHVMIQEAAQKIRHLHDKFSQDTSSFSWEKRLRTPPDLCPEAECADVQSCSLQDLQEGATENHVPILYGFGTHVADCNTIRVTANLSLGRIFNLLWLLPHLYHGITTPYTYFGSTHSFFGVHTEDAGAMSVNYLFLGHPKLWYETRNLCNVMSCPELHFWELYCVLFLL